jgi:hypothetical protein
MFCLLLGVVFFFARRHSLEGNVHFLLRFISYNYCHWGTR